jgi:hypothetical protein
MPVNICAKKLTDMMCRLLKLSIPIKFKDIEIKIFNLLQNILTGLLKYRTVSKLFRNQSHRRQNTGMS